jgi:predicted RNA-binding Zn-ribbon protein involved in translation (DUF1610 family)
MAIVARCDSCGMQFQAEPHLVGKTVPCPSCGGQLAVPTGRQRSSVNAARQQPAPAAMRSAAPARKPAVRAFSTPGTRSNCFLPLRSAFQSQCPVGGTDRGLPNVPSAFAGPYVQFDAQASIAAATGGRFLGLAASAGRADNIDGRGSSGARQRADYRSPGDCAGDQSVVSRAFPHQVRSQLIGQGVSQAETDRVVDSLVPESKSKHKSSGVGRGVTNMLIGGIICFIGLAVTVGSYVAAEPGGVFLLAYGPIIFGGIQFFRGCIQLAG